MTVTIRRVLLGIAVIAAYIVVAIATPFGPTRPLLDAVGVPQPYRWVNPPEIARDGNVVPHSVTHKVRLGATGSESQSLATPDGQAGLVFPDLAFAARAGEKTISVKIDPLDPATLAPPPRDSRFDGNAYRFTATYDKSKAEAVPTKPVTLVMRFAILATKIFRLDGERWTELDATPLGASLQIYGDTPTLGTFVAASPPLPDPEKKKGFPTVLVISILAAVVAAAAGFAARRRARSRRRPPRAARRRPPPRGRAGRGRRPR